jgi:hypothetical protein
VVQKGYTAPPIAPNTLVGLVGEVTYYRFQRDGALIHHS